MKRISGMAIGVVATVALTLSSGAAVAAPGENGKGLGGCIDQLHGNATNPRESGHGVLPSQSPGPWANNPDDPDNPTWGASLGAIIQVAGGSAGDLRGVECPFV